MSGKPLEHPCRASPRHAVPVRQGRRIVAAARSSASGAALPYSDSVLFAADHAIRSLSQLAAGPAEQLRRESDVPGKGRTSCGSRSTSWRKWPSTIRSTSSSSRPPNTFRSRTTRPSSRSAAVPAHRATHAAVGPLCRRRRSPAAADHRLPGRRQPQTAAGHFVRHPARPRNPGRRTDARAVIGLVPRHHVAARADLPASGTRLTFRVRLSDPAGPGREGAGRTHRRRIRLHRPPRVVRGVPAGRGLDRPRSDIRTARRRRTHSSGLHARANQRRAGFGWCRAMRGRVLPRDVGAADRRVASCHQALHRRAVEDDPRVRTRGRRRPVRRRRAPDDGRRADVRLDHRSGRRRMEHRRARADQTRACRRPAAPIEETLRRERLRAPGTGQVVSG